MDSFSSRRQACRDPVLLNLQHHTDSGELLLHRDDYGERQS